MFGWLRPGGVLRLAPEALDELLVARVPLVQHLQRDACARAPGPRRGRRRPSRPSRACAGSGSGGRTSRSMQGLVAIVVYGYVPFDVGGRIACMSSFAIGAATAPPKPFSWLLDDDGAGDDGVLGRREEDEPGVVDAVAVPVSAVPVLPATVTPGICALRAGPACDDLDHHVADRRRRSSASSRASSTCGCSLTTDAAAGETTCFTSVRPHHDAAVRDRRPRPSPSAAASTSIRSWPKARRPGSTCGVAGPSGRRACASSVVEPRGRRARRTASRAAASSRSRTSSPRSRIRSAPSFLPMLQNTALIECW